MENERLSGFDGEEEYPRMKDARGVSVKVFPARKATMLFFRLSSNLSVALISRYERKPRQAEGITDTS